MVTIRNQNPDLPEKIYFFIFTALPGGGGRCGFGTPPGSCNEKKPSGAFSSALFLYFCKDLQTDYGLGLSLNMAIRYYNDDCTFRLPQKRLTAAWLRAVAEAEGYTPGDVSYIFCSAQRLLEMNRQWLGHDYFTDVITFDYSDRKGARIISGDIFIDVETVADNARQYGCTTLQEMRRVIVHGVLHLCGQGDKTPRTNAQMHRKEDKYLKFWEAAQ